MSAVSGGETQRAAVAPGVKPPLAVPRRILRMRSDAALAERFAAGDEAAFDVLYERHRPVVLAVSMGVLGTSQDAEDATQETFSALAVALRTKPPAELRPWLIRVARNASIDTTRRRRHRLLTLDGEIPEIPARPASAGQAELAVVLDGIRELPEGQRMALLMRELGGHSYAEIAEFLETDEEAVKGLIARARVGLRTYREATEMPCAAARTTIAAEPDGRRYDKTVRRHLRTCASCRSYRAALRDDAKALRAALPLPAGGVATGGLSTGMLTAAKGTLIGYGLTQAATTCATTACAVGAIGGMVFVTPIHRLGVWPILPAAKSAPAHKHTVVAKPTTRHAVVLPAVHQSTLAPSSTGAVTKPATVSEHHHSVVKTSVKRPTHHATRHHATRHHATSTVTKVKLPTLPTHTTPAVTAPPVSPITASATQTPTTTAPATSTTVSQYSGGGSSQPVSTSQSGSSGSSGNSWSGSGSSSTSQSQSGGGTYRGNPVTSAAHGAGSSGTTTSASTTSTSTSTSTSTRPRPRPRPRQPPRRRLRPRPRPRRPRPQPRQPRMATASHAAMAGATRAACVGARATTAVRATRTASAPTPPA